MSDWDPIEALGRHQQKEARLAAEVAHLRTFIAMARASLAERDWITADMALEQAEAWARPAREQPWQPSPPETE